MDQPEPEPDEVRHLRAIVQYWSTHPLTPWGEYFRGMNVRSADEAAEIILRPWAGELELPDDVMDLNFDTAAGLGIAPDALVALEN